MLIVNISAQLEEAPHHVTQYVLLRRENLDAISFEDEKRGTQHTGASLPAKLVDTNSWLLEL